MIKLEIYKFEDAPDYMRELSDNGGDEDFVLVIYDYFLNDFCWNYPDVPITIQDFVDEDIEYLFGWGNVQRIKQGYHLVLILSH